MPNIILFKPKSELDTKNNLDNFITTAKNKIHLWSSFDDFEWKKNKWPTHNQNIRFINLSGRKLHHTKPIPIETLMSDSFRDFAKAYLRYTQHLKQTKTYSRTLTALQLIEASLLKLDGEADITMVTDRHFDMACELLITENLKDRSGVGNQLKKLAFNLGEWHIASNNNKYWDHSFRGDESNLGIEKRKTHEEKAKKLPNDDALLAIAEVFANGTHSKQDDEDIYITCVTCLLLCAPMRINEILNFRTNVLREEKDSAGTTQLYLSYWSPKTCEFVRKEIPEIMANHAREAVKRLLAITDESRRLALHFESGKKYFFRHKNCPDVPDDEILTVEQVKKALGYKKSNAVENFIKKHTGKRTLTGWTLNSLWKLVLIQHKTRNPCFPYQIKSNSNSKQLKMSESLICFRYRQLSSSHNTSPVLLTQMNSDFYAKRLDGRVIKRANKNTSMSFFKKHGYDLTRGF